MQGILVMFQRAYVFLWEFLWSTYHASNKCTRVLEFRTRRQAQIALNIVAEWHESTTANK